MALRFANKKIALICITLAAIVVCVVAVSLPDAGQKLLGPEWSNPDLQRGLTKPLRLATLQPNALAELVIGLRAFHYRTKPRSVVVYSDVFYDTVDWRLYQAGYSYRFRESNDDDGKVIYGVRFEQEPRFVSKGSKKTELREAVPGPMGAAISHGAWEEAVSGSNGLDITTRLLAVLQELGIATEAIQPRFEAELRRERFEITDKGQSWFELDHEIWTFHLFGDADQLMQFEDIVIDTRLKKNDPELVRRVVTMNRLSQMIHSVRAANRAPYERAIERFAFGIAN